MRAGARGLGYAAVVGLSLAHRAAAQGGIWPEPVLSGLKRVEGGVDGGPAFSDGLSGCL
jgi:hypothetical protein